MATVTAVERKTNVLRHPALPCMTEHYTINLTAGCPFECHYCYAQSFRHNPGLGKVLFYANSFELLKRELAGKRVPPRIVYFSTGCEPFNPHADVLRALFDTMSLLLENDVFVLISTKSHIPLEFINLLATHRDRVSISVGLTTVDDSVRSFLEPGAFPVEERLQSLSSLRSAGIPVEARMDPLIPGLTDSEESFAAVCRALQEKGVQMAVASYLFLRGAIIARMGRDRFGNWSFVDMANHIYTGRIEGYCGSGTIRVPSVEYKQDRFSVLKRIAAAYGVKLTLCACKNPDVTTDRCHAHLPSVVPKRLAAKTLYDSVREGDIA